MITKEINPRNAVILSYFKPVLYKDYILLDGTVKVVFRQAYIDVVVNIVVNKIKKGTTI